MRLAGGNEEGTAAVSANHCQALVPIKSCKLNYIENEVLETLCADTEMALSLSLLKPAAEKTTDHPAKKQQEGGKRRTRKYKPTKKKKKRT